MQLKAALFRQLLWLPRNNCTRGEGELQESCPFAGQRLLLFPEREPFSGENLLELSLGIYRVQSLFHY